MGNLLIAFAGPPDKHREFQAKINKWLYDTKGRLGTTGKQAPYICEWRVYDVRMPEEHESQFVTDLGLTDGFSVVGNTIRNWRMHALHALFSFVRLFTPLSPLPKPAKERKYTLAGWHYCFAFGKLRRQKMKTSVGTEREVL